MRSVLTLPGRLFHGPNCPTSGGYFVLVRNEAIRDVEQTICPGDWFTATEVFHQHANTDVPVERKMIYHWNNRIAYNQVTQITHLNFNWGMLGVSSYLLPNNFILDHCETLERPVSRSVIWHLLTQDVLGRCKKRYQFLFMIQKYNYILHILRFLGIISSAWIYFGKIKDDFSMNENTINERKKTGIGTGVQMSKKLQYNSLLRRAMRHGCQQDGLTMGWNSSRN